MLPVIHSFWLGHVRTVTVGTTSSMHLLMKSVTDVVYSSMPSEECQTIFQSVLAKQSSSLASASSDLFLTAAQLRASRCCITAWYGNCLASDRKALQTVACMAQYVTGAELPAIQNFYTRRCQKKALKLVKDSSQPSHSLFSLRMHGKWQQSATFGTKT